MFQNREKRSIHTPLYSPAAGGGIHANLEHDKFLIYMPLMAEKLRKVAKSPAPFPPPGGGGNGTRLFRFIRVRIGGYFPLIKRLPDGGAWAWQNKAAFPLRRWERERRRLRRFIMQFRCCIIPYARNSRNMLRQDAHRRAPVRRRCPGRYWPGTQRRDR